MDETCEQRVSFQEIVNADIYNQEESVAISRIQDVGRRLGEFDTQL